MTPTKRRVKNRFLTAEQVVNLPLVVTRIDKGGCRRAASEKQTLRALSTRSVVIFGT